MEPDQIKVLFAVLFVWGLLIAACRFAVRCDGRAPADDIGIMWLIILALYGTLPSVSWLVQGGEYSVISYQRLFRLQPTSDDFLELMSIVVAYACGFTAVYFSLRQSIPKPNVNAHARIENPQMMGALLFIVAYSLLTTALRAGGYIRASESYVDSYRAIQELPLGLRQVMKIAAGFDKIAQLVIVVALLQRWPRTKPLFVLYIATLLLTYDPGGSRTAIALALLAAGVVWHILIRPIPMRQWIGVGVMGLVAFTVLGILRGIGYWEDGNEEVSVGDGAEGVGLGELDALWANAMQLLQGGGSRLDIPMSVRYGEFLAFIPGQLLPFEKYSLPDWYLDTFDPIFKAEGGGWEFGAVSQAVIGGGIMEAALRGAIVALLGIGLMAWYRSPTATWWRFPLYLYLLTTGYMSIRESTFAPLTFVVQIAIPALFLIELMAELWTQATRSIMSASRGPARTSDA